MNLTESMKPINRMKTNKINWLHLNFENSEDEKGFRHAYFEKSLMMFRISFVMVTILYMSYGFLDVMVAPEFLEEFLIIRFAVVLPLLTIVFVLSFFKLFERVWQELLMSCFIVTGTGIIYMLVTIPDNMFYYGGFFLIFLAGFFFIRLRYFAATISSVVLIVIYITLFYQFAPEYTINSDFLLPSLSFYITTIIIGIVASYHIERLERHDYSQKENLKIKQAEIESINVNLEQLIEARTKELRKAKERAEANAVELSNAEFEIRRSRDEILLKNKISNSFILNDEYEIFNSTLKVVLEFVKCNFGYFGYISKKGDLICPSLTYEVWDQCEMPEKSIVFPKDTWAGIWGKSLFEKKTIFQNSGLTLPDGHAQIDNALAVPILYKSELIGQLVVANREGGFAQNHVDSLEDLCNYISPLLYSLLNQKRHEEELQKISKLESLGVLAGGIAHNFKNILTTMSFSAVIAKAKPEKAEKHLDKIIRSIDQASSLATRFQTFSKTDKPIFEPVDIHSIIIEASDIALVGSSIVPNFDFDRNIPKILLDAKRMNEVFTNIFINAKQAMTEGGKIFIRSLINEDEIDGIKQPTVQIDITDTGIGIPPEKIDDIFTPFFTTKADGHGLGLATVYSIIKKHGGSIKVESKLNQGTTFSLYLPMNKAENEQETADDSKLNLINDANILILDDNHEIIENIEELFADTGISITGFSDPDQLIKEYMNSMDTKKYDLVILDLTLVGYQIDGLGVLLKLKEIDENVKALVFSGHFDIPVVANYEEYGFVGRIEKPITFNQFLTEIAKVIID
jgi:signal transduction histidine kinase/CheY-like chemotaxis protein